MEKTAEIKKAMVEKVLVDITFTFGIDELKEQFFGHQEEEECTFEDINGWKKGDVIMIVDKIGNIKPNVEEAEKVEMMVYGANDPVKKEYVLAKEKENQLYFVMK